LLTFKAYQIQIYILDICRKISQLLQLLVFCDFSAYLWQLLKI